MKYRPQDCFHTIEQYGKTACFSCHGRPAKLMRCTRCRRVVYCNASCQKEDWAVHQHICNAWVNARKRTPPSAHPVLHTYPPDMDQLASALTFCSINLITPIKVELGDRAGNIISPLVVNEPRCGRCPKVDEVAVGGKLEGCPDCVYRWCAEDKCRETCRKQHKSAGTCAKLQRMASDERALRQHDLDYKPGDPLVPYWCPPRLIRVDTPLPSGWKAYADSVGRPSQGPDAFERIFVQHSLSVPLTIVAVIERFCLRPAFSDRAKQRDMTIHLIGAELDFEVLSVGLVYEEISHLLPGVKNLKIVMVGPSLDIGPTAITKQGCCPTCTKDGRSRVIERVRSSYHDYLSSTKPASPDIAVGFNSGMDESSDSWLPTLLLLLQGRVPTVFTSFNSQEARDDARLVAAAPRLGRSNVKVSWAWREEENPWKTGRDHFDIFSPEGVWKENFYWMGFRGT